VQIDPGAPPLLELTNAAVVKNGRRVLDGLTLTIPVGQHTAILGPNGAGKTTFINLLTRDDYPLASGGQVPMRIFGKDTWDLFELRTRLGVVSSDLHQQFVAGNSVGYIRGLDAVLSGFFATRGFLLYATVTEAMKRSAASALARIGASHLAAKPLNEMSTGEARRVLIARALVSEPAALVLDEPTAGLDVVARHRFLMFVRRIAQQGTTIVMVTHHVDEIIPEIGRVILLQNGRVAADGEKHRLLTDQVLSGLFDSPIRVSESNGSYTMVSAAGTPD
jgi:iron complex transport system ATP-binding protein